MRQIYVETVIQGSMEDVWGYTQDPGLHQRWDGRFGRIIYVPETDPQELRYSTLGVAGTGVTVGERHRHDGGRTSSITFGSAHPLSPLRSGAGYWRYEPTPDGIRFLTGYDYRPGWGRPLDRIVRPLMGWLTAWSFDRLRLWVETGMTPERARTRAIGEVVARFATVIATGAAAGLAPALGAAVVAAVIPPLPGTPAARRCIRNLRGRTSLHRLNGGRP